MVSDIQSIILDYANGDFSRRLVISDRFDENDVIAAGINMLGEELEDKSISKDYFFNILNSIPQIVIVFDLDAQIKLINQMGSEYFKNECEIIGYIFKSFFPDGFDKKNINFSQFTKKAYQFELLLNENWEDQRFLLCTLTKIAHQKTTHFLFVAKDITNNKNEELLILKATILGQEFERKRLAYDLHDSLGQELSALKMNLNALEMMDFNSPSFKKTLTNIHMMLNSTISSVRDISYDLIPSKFEDQGLKSCILQLINQLNAIDGINISCQMTRQSIKLKDKNDELFIYRVFQEFLNNSIKYANAKKIIIEISKDSKVKKVTFNLRDNGNGFDIKDQNKAHGIDNIRYRLETLNAKYFYKSQPTKGTTLEFEIYE